MKAFLGLVGVDWWFDATFDAKDAKFNWWICGFSGSIGGSIGGFIGFQDKLVQSDLPTCNRICRLTLFVVSYVYT